MVLDQVFSFRQVGNGVGQGPVWKRAQTSVSDVEVEPKGERGDCSVDEEVHRGCGRGGNVEEGTTGSRYQRL